MGLDQYAYVAARAGQDREYWNSYNAELDSSEVEKPREIAYWRKHPNLQGWMRDLWESKGRPGTAPESPFEQSDVKQNDVMFNGVELELTWEDLDRLEADVKANNLPSTKGFFFGEPSDEYYRSQDLKFIKEARAELFVGLRVFYNSSW